MIIICFASSNNVMHVYTGQPAGSGTIPIGTIGNPAGRALTLPLPYTFSNPCQIPPCTLSHFLTSMLNRSRIALSARVIWYSLIPHGLILTVLLPTVITPVFTSQSMLTVIYCIPILSVPPDYPGRYCLPLLYQLLGSIDLLLCI
jgi:hypothetical protein